MYATMVQCAMPGVASPHARGRLGRTLAAALGALPGFVAFVAFDGDSVSSPRSVCLRISRAWMRRGM